MRKLIELKEYDYITCDKYDIHESGNHILSEKEFEYVESFIHDFTPENDSDILDFVKISYNKRNTGPVISMKNYVGLIQFRNGLQIEILPKISFSEGEDVNNTQTKRIFLKMLSSLKEFTNKVFTDSTLDVSRMNIYEIFIRMYIQETHNLISQGLKSDYISSEDNLHFCKGKLIFNKQLRENMCHKERFYVSYDEYSLNRPENRIIKTTLLKLSKISSSIENVKRINQLLNYFDPVNTSVNPEKDFNLVKPDRNTRNYENLINWSKVFLLNKSFTTFSGDNNSRALLFPMEKIFEAYTAKYVKKIFSDSGWNVSAQDTGHYLFTHLDGMEYRKFSLRPDIVITKDNQTVIMDTKWKRLCNDKRSNYGISQADMYQMYAYGKKYNTNEVWLLYPMNEEMEAGRIITFDSENDVRVNVYFVDVSKIEESTIYLRNIIEG